MKIVLKQLYIARKLIRNTKEFNRSIGELVNRRINGLTDDIFQ